MCLFHTVVQPRRSNRRAYCRAYHLLHFLFFNTALRHEGENFFQSTLSSMAHRLFRGKIQNIVGSVGLNLPLSPTYPQTTII